MESQSILYAKDVNTNKTTLLNSRGNALMLSNKLANLSDSNIDLRIGGERYSLGYGPDKTLENWSATLVTMRMYGFIKKDLFTNTTLHQDVLDRNNWTYTAANTIYLHVGVPLRPHGTQVQRTINPGWIKLYSSTKLYRIDVTATMSTWNINTETVWEGIIIETDNSNILSTSKVTQFRDYQSVNILMTCFYTPFRDNLPITVKIGASDGAGGISEATIDWVDADHPESRYFNASLTVTVQEVGGI